MLVFGMGGGKYSTPLFRYQAEDSQLPDFPQDERQSQQPVL